MKKVFLILFILLLSAKSYAGGLFSGCYSAGFGTNITLTYLLDENCSDITDWTDGDSGSTAESSQVTFDGRAAMKLTVATGGSARYARRYIDFGSTPTNITVEFTAYCDSVGTVANIDYFRIGITRAGLKAWLLLASDGAFTTSDGSTWFEIGTNEVTQDSWQTWKMIINATGGDASATMDVYVDGDLVGNDVDCSYTGSLTDGTIDIWQLGYATSGVTTYVDDVQVYY